MLDNLETLATLSTQDTGRRQTNTENQKDEQYGPHQKLRVSQVFAKGRVRVAASYKTPAMLLI
jgi:hypothetical protein